MSYAAVSDVTCSIDRRGPPIHRCFTTAVRRPDRATCQAISLPPIPLPTTKTSKCIFSVCRFVLFRFEAPAGESRCE
jgi:hypothetical protein